MRSIFRRNSLQQHSSATKVAEMLAETRAELDEFQVASRELEAELEAELHRTEKAQQDLKVKAARAEAERDEWKARFYPVLYRTTYQISFIRCSPSS